MIEFDMNDSVLEWSSEEMAIPYKSPIDGKWHRYFPDFIIKMKDKSGKLIVKMIEVKPFDQTQQPAVHDRTRKPTRRYLTEVARYGINTAKWKAAHEYCIDRGWEFVIITEKDLGRK